MIGSPWEGLARAKSCAACARAFVAGEEIHSRLRVVKATLERTDACGSCAASLPSDPAAPFWRTRIPEAPPKREAYDAAELFTILKRVLEEGPAGRERLCYLLALYCCRKRLLRLKGVEHSGGAEVLVFRAPRGGAEYRIPSVEMGEAELAGAREELARVAEGAGASCPAP